MRRGTRKAKEKGAIGKRAGRQFFKEVLSAKKGR